MRYVLLILVLIASEVRADQLAREPDHRDVTYKHVADVSLKLDLYLPPPSTRPAPCVVFVHGGGWKNGSKESGQKNAAWLTEHGFAVASIDYRLTDAAQWPAQIDDCYSAVRWVRDNAAEYGIDPARVGAWGTSAGAHLAALMGTRRCPDSETTSSRVQAVCDWFGPSELLTMPPNNASNDRTEEEVANSNGAKLLGATVRDVPELARDASGLNHVTSDDAVFLIMHGDQDEGVPLSQSRDLHAALVRAGVPSTLRIIAGAGHGGKQFQTEQNRRVVLTFFQDNLRSNWKQGPGPQGTFRVRQASPPTQWSVVRDQNIRWRKRLPETGQSTVVRFGNRIFFTTMKPTDGDSKVGKDIVAYCCDVETGDTIWKRLILADHPLRLSGCFSDSSSPSPVTDGRYVCFFNASGRIACFTIDGQLQWEKAMMAVGRSQPVLVGPDVVFIKQTYLPDSEGHFTHDHRDAPVDQWTQLQALNVATGEESWATSCGVNMGAVPLPMTLADGRTVMIVGRGGGHSPPEKPAGVSMIDTADGSTVWTLPLPKFMSTMTFNSLADDVLVFDAGDHLWVDAASGKITRRQSFVKDVDVRLRDVKNQRWHTEKRTIDVGKKTRAIIQQSNTLAGRYHYFRSYTQPWLGRLDVVSGKVEQLQLPVQLKRTADSAIDQLLWDASGMSADAIKRQKQSQRKPPKALPIQLWSFEPNDMKNARGHVVMGDERSRGNGWGHHASQVPSVIGDYLFVPVMNGTVYVIRWNAETLDESAIVAINDLGPVGRSFNRASLSFGGGRLYAHTIREIICIADEK